MVEAEQIGDVRKFRMARTFAGHAVYFTAAYWVDGLMVDTGCAYTVRELVNAVNDLSIDLIINTHSHEDHVAGNAALQSKFKVKVFAHPAALPVLSSPRDHRLRPYQRIMWGNPPPSNGTAIGDVIETNNHRFEIIHTPGHSQDHICLFEPLKGWLFSGDAYVGGRDRALRLDYNIWLIISSLKRMASLKPKVLFPGSGSIRREPLGDLVLKISYLEEMGEKIFELEQKGWSRRRIRRKLFGIEMPIAYYTLGHFSGKNLVRSYIEDRPGRENYLPIP